MTDERIDVDFFDRLTVVSHSGVHAAAPGGLPNLGPVGSPVAGPAKGLRVHQRFQQQGTIPVGFPDPADQNIQSSLKNPASTTLPG
jgi:hypothetical protein